LLQLTFTAAAGSFFRTKPARFTICPWLLIRLPPLGGGCLPTPKTFPTAFGGIPPLLFCHTSGKPPKSWQTPAFSPGFFATVSPLRVLYFCLVVLSIHSPLDPSCGVESPRPGARKREKVKMIWTGCKGLPCPLGYFSFPGEIHFVLIRLPSQCFPYGTRSRCLSTVYLCD